ncbi:MAG: hypothetical protein ACP5QG_06225 [candidate division WOR-3 bacterium]
MSARMRRLPREEAFLKVWPNLTPGTLRISWSKGPADILIYDVMGRETDALPWILVIRR